MLNDVANLTKACYRGLTSEVLRLLASGVNIHEFDDAGDSAIHAAIAGDQIDTVRLLLQHGADIEQLTHDGWWTPLIHALENSLDAQSQIAAASPDLSMVRLLLDAGANPYHRTEAGFDAVEFARNWGSTSALDLLALYLPAR